MKITHPTQINILKALTTNGASGYSDLNKAAEPEMTSDNFNFHLKKLAQLGAVHKDGQIYKLTDKGLEFASRIDLDATHIFKQPKVSVAVAIFRDRRCNELLLSQRKYQPLQDYWSFHTEKMRFGEKYSDTIERCLLSETGLSEFEYEPIGSSHLLREHDGEFISDVIHILFKVFPKSFDELQMETEFIKNSWVPASEASKVTPTTQTFLKILKQTLDADPIFEESLVSGRL